ncbi:hypothetical protein [Caenimonas aquaedulcis]|uniref:Uncharacterized protein n=1 Tax=Caenimonas aquaedulcis TaxID=2793270 RepID=A0A931MGV2_9BURK|nr:hypothetical protein [Caenimonas aquaedulcis]MBG9388382.1 hypothetical protein [Caenimonas aquaedulcis]
MQDGAWKKRITSTRPTKCKSMRQIDAYKFSSGLSFLSSGKTKPVRRNAAQVNSMLERLLRETNILHQLEHDCGTPVELNLIVQACISTGDGNDNAERLEVLFCANHGTQQMNGATQMTRYLYGLPISDRFEVIRCTSITENDGTVIYAKDVGLDYFLRLVPFVAATLAEFPDRGVGETFN